MVNAASDYQGKQKEDLVEKVSYLADEVKLLSINLAIALARLRGRESSLNSLEPRFTSLIKKANDTSQQVSDVLKTFKERKRIMSSLPASTEVIERRGAYDCLEAKLMDVYRLSRDMMEIIGSIKRQKQAG